MMQRMWKWKIKYQCLLVLVGVSTTLLFIHFHFLPLFQWTQLKPLFYQKEEYPEKHEDVLGWKPLFWQKKYPGKHEGFWSCVEMLLATSKAVGLEVVVMEPGFLRDIEAGRARSSLWIRQGGFLTFGVIDPSEEALVQLSNTVSIHKLFDCHVMYDVDPRGVSASTFIKKEKLPSIPMHFLLRSRDERVASLFLHLVIFRTRGDYLWHGQLSPLLASTEKNREDASVGQSFPFPMSNLSIGQHAALIDRFPIRKESIGFTDLSLPANISSLLHSLQDGALVECNHRAARFVATHYKRELITGNQKFRSDILKMLGAASKALDKLGVTFWLSSGTALGWYRQCDVIPYAGDADLEMRIEDYSPTLIKAMEAAGLRLIRRLGKVEDSLELTFKSQFNLDIFFRYEGDNYTYVSCFDPKTFEKYRYVFPEYSLRWVDFAGVRVRVPYPPEIYLEALYSKDWIKPKTDYLWLTSATNAMKVGVWPKEERAGIRQTFK